MLEKLFNITKKKPETKDVALTLSSGGARGLAHIGAIEVLEEQGYHIDCGLLHGRSHRWRICSRKTAGVPRVDEGHRPQEDAGTDRLLLVA